MTTDEKFDYILGRLDAIDKYLLDFREEAVNRLDIIEGRLTTMAGLYQSLEPRMSAFAKAILDFGAVTSRLQIEQSRIAKLMETSNDH